MQILSTFSDVVTNTQNVFADYEKQSQVESSLNECRNGDDSFNILCQTIAFQIQGDQNTANLIGGQTSNERIEPIVQPEPVTTVNVVPNSIDGDLTLSHDGSLKRLGGPAVDHVDSNYVGNLHWNRTGQIIPQGTWQIACEKWVTYLLILRSIICVSEKEY